MVIQCPDDLVIANHPVRMVMAGVEKLDLSRFHEPIKARQGPAETHPQLLVALWRALAYNLMHLGPALLP